ncbi:NAD(P)/FAD-dependent oxidoreductase [Actinoallomurus acanthiterrae]
MRTDASRPPQSALVVGAGMAGLATAWFLQERGVEVTVVERRRVAAGASWGNAGWLTPSLAVPLPAPAMLRTGLRELLSPASPLYVPPRADPKLGRFLAALAGNCTDRRWRVSMSALAPLNRRALDAYDALADGGVKEPTVSSDRFLIVCRTATERQAFVDELEQVRAAGQDVGYEPLTGGQVRDAEPALSDAAGPGLFLHGQRYIDPPAFIAALAGSVRARGGRIVEDSPVRSVRDTGDAAVVATAAGTTLRADAVVLAAGAWLTPLARAFGVRTPVQAGRGYSFSVSGRLLPSGPTYFPGRHVVCTPLGDGRVRVSGMMEFTAPDRPLDPRRVRAVIAAARPMLRDVDWDARTDEWVGSRPCSTDGLPLVGPTRSPRVFVCGGHTMWGIALGPLTGRLLAETITTGRPVPELTPLHPLR